MKKSKEIRGCVLYLAVGESARIKIPNGKVLQTSRVEHFIQYPDGTYWIETAHTKYIVCPT